MTRQRCNSMERESDSRYPSPPSEGARCADICHQEPRLRLRVGSPGEISPWSFLKVFNAHMHANSELVLLNASAIVIVAGLVSRLLIGFFVNPVLYEMVARERDVLQV